MFTTPISKPKASETWNGVGKPLVSETYSKVGKPKASETWVAVILFTAPADAVADVGEADIAVLSE